MCTRNFLIKILTNKKYYFNILLRRTDLRSGSSAAKLPLAGLQKILKRGYFMLSNQNLETNQKILIYGAGAIGSIFAGMIVKKGYDVTLLARGKRLEELNQNGLILVNSVSGKKVKINIKTTDVLNENDLYDYIIVVVQNTQIDPILPILSKNKSKNIVFVVNNPAGYDKWIEAVGYERIIIGFPSAGGERKNGAVNYFIGKGAAKLFQSTTFGELNGKRTQRLSTLIKIFRNSGFSPEINNNMEAWQKTHVAIILPIGKALYRFNSDNYKLAKSYDTLKKMIKATRECFSVLKALKVKVTPGKLNFYYLPLFIIVPIFMVIMGTKIAEFAMAKHTVVAKDEMNELEKLFMLLVEKSGIKTPNLQSL